MTNLMKKSFMLTIFTALLVFAGCSSSSTKDGNSDALSSISQSDIDNALNFELNADSDSGRAGGLQTITFGYNSSSLGASAMMKLEANAALLKQVEGVQIQVEGHSDERGGVQYNLALGERRSQVVRDYLISMGVSGSRISTISFGKERPVAYGHDNSAWSQNRRANFVVTAK